MMFDYSPFRFPYYNRYNTYKARSTDIKAYDLENKNNIQEIENTAPARSETIFDSKRKTR